MLVLTRKKGESVIVQDNIEITILEVEGDAVKIGISAPKEVDIYRKELYLSIQQSNLESTQHPVNLSEMTKSLSEIKKV